MFRAKTVLVLGAGAHCEVGMPSGEALLRTIADDVRWQNQGKVAGDFDVWSAFQRDASERGVDHNLYWRAGWRVADAADQGLSIDNIIDSQEDSAVAAVGKCAIVNSILKAEARSRYFKRVDGRPHTLRLREFGETWYIKLSQLIFDGLKRREIGKAFENLTVINFNYDRCLEHYISVSLEQYYGAPRDEVLEVVRELEVYHPYGVVGRLSWQNGSSAAAEFGETSPHNLLELAQQIKTFTEGVTTTTSIDKMRERISEADRVVFLGFAFHRRNVELLKAKVQPHTKIIGTAYGVSNSDCSAIKDEIADVFEISPDEAESRIALEDKTCVDLFRAYWRTLTAGPPKV